MIDKRLLDTYVVYIYGLNISMSQMITDMFYLSQLFYRSMFLDFNITV